MSRTVLCRKYNKELPALTSAPFPGAAGIDILENVSQQAWAEWTEHQTRLINEKHLNMMDLDARKYLSEQMDLFLSGGEHDHAEGYVPPSQTSE